MSPAALRGTGKAARHGVTRAWGSRHVSRVARHPACGELAIGLPVSVLRPGPRCRCRCGLAWPSNTVEVSMRREKGKGNTLPRPPGRSGVLGVSALIGQYWGGGRPTGNVVLALSVTCQVQHLVRNVPRCVVVQQRHPLLEPGPAVIAGEKQSERVGQLRKGSVSRTVRTPGWHSQHRTCGHRSARHSA